MSKARAKTIQLLLDDGDLKGVISMDDTSWNSGKFYSAPRDAVDNLIHKEGCKNYGVYLLLSNEKVYVGQASDLSRRISQHIIGKSWWDRVVVFTTKDDSFNRADIDFLEATLIEKAEKVGRLDSENKNKGNRKKVDEFRRVFLEQYLEEALFLLELIGINVFNETKKKARRGATVIDTGDNTISDSSREIRAKREAIEYLKEKGVMLGTNITYARLQEKRDEYWANPKVDMLNKDWNLILNNQKKGLLTVLFIPKNKFSMKDSGISGFINRADRPEQIDLNISDDNLIDRRSSLSLRDFIVNVIDYNK